MVFSIIIPTCNRNNQLALCLDRLAPGSQTLPAHNYEVIVTDDSPNAAAEAFCHQHYPWVRYYRGPMQGPAANRNHGARHANAPWLVFTDDDCLPDLRWLAAYQDAIAQYPESLAFEGAILPDNPKLLEKDMAECPVNDKGGCFWSANIMIAATLFERIGGFDERFKIAANEDQAIFWYLNRLTTIPFVKESFVIHPIRFSSIGKKFFNFYRRGESWVYFMIIKENNLIKILIAGLLNTKGSLLFTFKYKKPKLFISHTLNFLFYYWLIPFMYWNIKRKNLIVL